jgi:2Fe-2S ferredoxin
MRDAGGRGGAGDLVMIGVLAVDRDGHEHSLSWEPQQSLMECLRDSGLPVLASCGGNAACATCHVYLEPDAAAGLDEPGADERDLLEDSDQFRRESSRLACQVDWAQRLDGLRVQLAPEG